MNIKVGPSILASDFSQLGDEIKRVEAAGADYLHVDIMDGHFVPNLTIGPAVVASIRDKTRMDMHIHLMIDNPGDYIKPFADSGADIISFHVEALKGNISEKERKALDLIDLIKKEKKRPAVAINPGTDVSEIRGLLSRLDWVLVMSVNPGFGGQKFIADVLPKIEVIRENFKGDLEVDGGINGVTAKEAVKAGANALAAGTYIFRAENMHNVIRGLKNEAT